MTSEWYINKLGREYGPFTGWQIRALAASGRLKETDLLRPSNQKKVVLAKQVKNLYLPDREDRPLAPLSPERHTSPPPVASVGIKGEDVAGVPAIPLGQGDPRADLPAGTTAASSDPHALRNEPGQKASFLHRLFSNPAYIKVRPGLRGATARLAPMLRDRLTKLPTWQKVVAVAGVLMTGFCLFSCVGGVIMHLAGVSPQGDKNARPGESNGVQSASVNQPQQATGEEITPDFFPFAPGTKRTYYDIVFLSENQKIEKRVVETQEAESIREVVVTATGVDGTGARAKLPQMEGAKLIRYYRKEESTILIGDEDKVLWQPWLKLGAKRGDTWQHKEIGPDSSYKVVEFGPHAGVPHTGLPSVIVLHEWRAKGVNGQESVMKTSRTYVKGIGLAFEKVELNDGPNGSFQTKRAKRLAPEPDKGPVSKTTQPQSKEEQPAVKASQSGSLVENGLSQEFCRSLLDRPPDELLGKLGQPDILYRQPAPPQDSCRFLGAWKKSNGNYLMVAYIIRQHPVRKRLELMNVTCNPGWNNVTRQQVEAHKELVRN